MQFVDHTGTPSDVYPYNPNGSSGGNTAYTDASGRHNIMMPHIERRNNASDTDWDGVFLNYRVFAEEQNQNK